MARALVSFHVPVHVSNINKKTAGFSSARRHAHHENEPVAFQRAMGSYLDGFGIPPIRCRSKGGIASAREKGCYSPPVIGS
jgi:hypothetical protein